MATSEVAICNSALLKLGSARITSLSDTSAQAVFMNEQYSKIRDDLLSSHPWNFAIKRVEVAQDVTAPAYGWAYRYVIPIDVLRILWIGQGTEELHYDEWTREEGYILTDLSTLKIKYIAQITDVSQFPAFFSEALSWRLAQDYAWAATSSASLVAVIERTAEKRLKEARSYDAQENYPQLLHASDWVDVRK